MFLSCLLLFAIAFCLGRLFMQTTEEIPALVVGMLAITFLVAGIIIAPTPIQAACLIGAACLKKFMLKEQQA
jgi:membrane protein YdbS with pleckstrin-like domain